MSLSFFNNSSHATALFIPPKNIRKTEVSNVFRGYRMRQVA